jgi:hypothetical protein
MYDRRCTYDHQRWYIIHITIVVNEAISIGKYGERDWHSESPKGSMPSLKSKILVLLRGATDLSYWATGAFSLISLR